MPPSSEVISGYGNLHTCYIHVYAVALGKQWNFLVYGCDTALYIMIHDLLSSGVTYLCVHIIIICDRIWENPPYGIFSEN